jgi:hypothetical protein
MGEHREPVQRKNTVRPKGYGFELNEPDIHLMTHAFINLYKRTRRQRQKAGKNGSEQQPPGQA